jgi:hypothetical protein
MTPAGGEALFVYGTLLDPEVQRALFDRDIPGDPAILEGWAVYRSRTDGFLFIKPSGSDRASGLVLLLSPDELRIADAWEDVPLYQRERVTVAAGDVWTYTRRDGDGIKYEGSEASGHDRQQVIAWARRLRADYLSGGNRWTSN